MKTPGVLTYGFLLLAITGYSAPIDSADLAKKKLAESHSHWRLTTRLHDKGIFNFSGRLGSENPVLDVNFVYDRKTWGLFFFKGQDLVDRTTFYNFCVLTFNKQFRIGKQLVIAPAIGTLLEQGNGIADHGSDVVSQVTSTLRVSKHVTVEHMTLLGNLVIEPEARDWVNRVRVLYSGKHLDITGSVWHNNGVFDHSSYWSSGLSIGYNRLRLADHFFLGSAVSSIAMIQTTDAQANPKNNSIAFTISLQYAK
jgi:hypothetical protein